MPRAVQSVVDQLVLALRERSQRAEHVRRFQALVRDTRDLDRPTEHVALVRTLARDLDRHSSHRADKPSPFGDDRLEAELRAALAELQPDALEAVDAPPYTPQLLAADVRRLDALRVTSKAELSAWYDEAQAVLDVLKRSAGVNQVPHTLWHWFSDRDIRFKDPDCARQQDATLQRMLSHLDTGQWDDAPPK